MKQRHKAHTHMIDLQARAPMSAVLDESDRIFGNLVLTAHISRTPPNVTHEAPNGQIIGPRNAGPMDWLVRQFVLSSPL
jgi:hypothetical protein